jgi:hypothetical protein
LGATIAVVDEPLSTGIEKVFPWLWDKNVPLDLTDSRDPYYEESRHNILYKAAFVF